MGKKNVHFGSLNCTVKRGLWISDDLKAPVCPDLPLFPGPSECGQCDRLLRCSWPVVAIGCCMTPSGSSLISRLHCICSYVVAILAPLWKCVCWCLSTPGRSQGRVSHRRLTVASVFVQGPQSVWVGIRVNNVLIPPQRIYWWKNGRRTLCPWCLALDHVTLDFLLRP